MAAVWFFMFTLFLAFSDHLATAELRQNFYADTCPDAETIVRKVVVELSQTSPATIPAAIRLIFHDCAVRGCDASILIQSTDENNKAEIDHDDNVSMPKAAFDTVIRAKAAIDAKPGCENRVSCADIIVMAARDAVSLARGPWYPVELGRLDGLSSTVESVNGKLPHANSNMDELLAIFGALGLSQMDMVALSGAHTVGISRCNQFENRIYNFSSEHAVDPTMNASYAEELRKSCGRGGGDRRFAFLDAESAGTFDNGYYKSLQQHKGLLSSDQVLYMDPRSKPTVDRWAGDGNAFDQAFITAMTKMGRVGVKTGSEGNIRVDCTKFNQ